MPQYVKFGALGVPKEVSEGEMSHVLLTANEFYQFFADAVFNQNAKEKAEQECEAERRERVRVERAFQKKLQEAEERIQELQKDLIRMENEVEQAKAQNDHLARINKERANANRGLHPKKEHSGYVLVSSTDPRGKGKNFTTVMQTPFTLAMQRDDVLKRVTADLNGSLGQTIGLDRELKDNIANKIHTGLPASAFKNDALDIFLRASSKDGGYWEVIFEHKEPIMLPPEVLPMPKE